MRVPAAILVGVLTATLVSGLGGAAAAQPPPPPPPRPAQPVRDVVPRTEPTGTGVIRGHVIAADTGSPIRRARVNVSFTALATVSTTTTVNGIPVSVTMTQGISVTGGSRGAPPPGGPIGVSVNRPGTATTDAQGAFEFTGLPEGSYRVSANAGQYSAAYLGMAYGARKPSGPFSPDPGQPIQLAAGQVFDKAIIALPRGAVITGRVSDENSDALARVQVYTLFYPPGSSRGQRMGSGAETDDLGQFRLFGLQPGDYVVVAEARGPTFVQPNAPAETEDEKIGFMTTFYPGTADEGAAQRVRARTGAETPGIEIRMATGRLFYVSGVVTDSQGRALRGGNGQMIRRTPGMSGTQSFGFSTDQQGMFQMRNIPPGNYRLTIRQQPRAPAAILDGSQNDPGEMASMPLTIATDLENLLVTTSPGVTISGQIVFEQEPPQQMQSPMRVTAQFGDPENGGMMGQTPSAVVTPDGTFTLRGLMGEYLLHAGVSGQYVKSVTVGSEDISDTPRVFKAGDRVTITMTSRASTLEGIVTDAKGEPSADAGIMLFSEDKASWRSNSTRMRRAGVDQATGHYRLPGLMPGRYFIVAVPRDRLNASSMGADASFFEQLSKDATTVVVGEDEQRQMDLKVVPADSGGM